MACSDCRIDFGVSIHVCSKRACRTAHDLKCPHALKERIETYRKALDAIWSWCQLQPDDNAIEAVVHIEELVSAAFGHETADTYRKFMAEWNSSEGGVIEFRTDVDAIKAMHLIAKMAGEQAKNIVAAKTATEKGGL